MKSFSVVIATFALLGCEGATSRSAGETSQTDMAASMPAPAAPPSFGREGGIGGGSGTGGGGGGGIGGVGADGGMRRGATRVGEPTRMPSPEDVSSEAPDQLTTPADPAVMMIIRTGDATVEVDSLEIAVAQVTALATRLGGAVASSSMETGRNDIRRAQLSLRIPSARFEAALSGLSPIGKVESQNVGSQDVTEEFVDVTARVTNARRLEDRLIDLLAKRTGKLEEVLAVERELARVREQIERYEGRLRYLRTRAAISTLTINLHEPYPIIGNPRGSNVIVEAFKAAWRNFVNFIAGLISAAGILIPLAVLVAVFVYFLRRTNLWPSGRWTRRDPTDRPTAPPRTDAGN